MAWLNQSHFQPFFSSLPIGHHLDQPRIKRLAMVGVMKSADHFVDLNKMVKSQSNQNNDIFILGA
jgi:hypothetical protein